MKTASLQDFQRDPLALLRRAEAGESIVVTQDDRPVAELRPASPASVPPRAGQRPYGLAAGAFTVPDDFDAPLPDEVLCDFERS